MDVPEPRYARSGDLNIAYQPAAAAMPCTIRLTPTAPTSQPITRSPLALSQVESSKGIAASITKP